MIKYQLACAQGHSFDGWFKSIAEFDDQQTRALLSCPTCGTTAIDRRPMAPAVMTGAAKRDVDGNTPSLRFDQNTEEKLAAARALKRALLENSQDVGQHFAEEARKIHFGETDARAIHGQATNEDAKELAEAGIDFGILPRLPEDTN
ncbi:MAG: DUF1178 family protein [Hyphomicrobium sp.]|nr:DUF1178 family protein [Hyphomicrobium sp.]